MNQQLWYLAPSCHGHHHGSPQRWSFSVSHGLLMGSRTHQSGPLSFSRHPGPSWSFSFHFGSPQSSTAPQPCVLPHPATTQAVTTAIAQCFAHNCCHGVLTHRDFSAIVLPWLSLNKAPTLPRYRCHVAVVAHTVVVAKPRFALVVDLRFTLIVTTVASLQGLEQLSTAAAAAAVLLCTCIALLLDVLAVVVVLPHRAATIIVAHCNAATVLSTRRSPFTVIGLHQLFVAASPDHDCLLASSCAPTCWSTFTVAPSLFVFHHVASSLPRELPPRSVTTTVLPPWFSFFCLGSTAHASALPWAWHFSLSCLLASRTFVSNMGALARNFASVVLLLWWSFSRNSTTSCATVVILGLLRDSFPHDLAVIALQPRHATMGLFSGSSHVPGAYLSSSRFVTRVWRTMAL